MLNLMFWQVFQGVLGWLDHTGDDLKKEILILVNKTSLNFFYECKPKVSHLARFIFYVKVI